MAVGIATSRVESILKQIATLSDEKRLILRGITWREYQELLDELGEHRWVLVSFSEGVLEIMPLSRRHERLKGFIARLIWAIAEERKMDLEPAGSTTLQLESIKKGAEPDTSFFIQHAAQMMKDTHDLLEDPPPDLVVEVDIFHPSYSKQELYASFGVPEIWQYDGREFRILQLVGHTYAEAERSLAFPFLHTTEIAAFVERSKAESQVPLIKSFQEWLRAN
ncbi:MAG TPA: Uma2 family endonuclease, partial [Blastocatellia bacterium]|nr:Uma2 family endonuclease [Blastocatellia bacterium]